MFCKFCGNEIDSHKKFCNSSCAAKYNNAHRRHTKETKEKISKSVKTYKEKTRTPRYKKCVVCGQIFEVKLTNSGRYSKAITCSSACSFKRRSINSKEKYERLKKENRFVGWKTRNVVSYPERFFIKVLNNNDIKFEKEYHIDKKYFLDFYIVKNEIPIDLEIDGKQHENEERKVHDAIRDEYIKSKGIRVYRIKWNTINTKKGKNEMQNKINNFLEYYRNL